MIIIEQLPSYCVNMRNVCVLISMCICLCIFMGVHPLHRELSRIREHDAFVSQQVEHAHQQLAGALEHTHTNSE